MKNVKKYLRNVIIFLSILILTYYIVFKDQDGTEIFGLLKTVDIKYVMIAILCMFVYEVCEAINLGRGLKALNEKSSLLSNIKYVLIGSFFSGITPAASGGQPMQIYYMHKDDIAVANSTLALLMNLTCTQIATISIGITSAVINFQYMNKTLFGFFLLGIFLNGSALTLLLLAIFSMNAFNKITNFAMKILKWLKIPNIDKLEEKIEREVDIYNSSSKYLKKHKRMIVQMLIITFVQYFAFYSVAYWIYRSFGLNNENIFRVTSIQAMLYATVSGIPSPGAVGVSEGGYIEIFKNIIPDNMLKSVMILTRAINFYFLLIVGMFVTMYNSFKEKKAIK